MAERDYFDLSVAVNPAGEVWAPVADATFQAFSVDDLSYTTPLLIEDPISGVTINPLKSSTLGGLQPFSVAGNPHQIILKSGSFVTRLTSMYGRRGEPGRSAFEAAVLGGYTGSETEFNSMLSGLQATIVGGSIDGDGHLILSLSSGGTVDAGVARGAQGVGFVSPSDLPDGTVPIVASGAWGYGPMGSGGGSGGPSPVVVYKWTGTAWPTIPGTAPAGAVLRIFDANGYPNATLYTGPTWAGVTDWFILPEA